jgi:hypothetical protein
MPLHVSSTCAHHQEVKIALHNLWYASNSLNTEINILKRVTLLEENAMKRWSSGAPPEMWVLLLAPRIWRWLLDFWNILGILNGGETFTHTHTHTHTYIY